MTRTAASDDARSRMPWLASYPAGIAWDQRLAATTLPALFDQAVSAFGARPCTVFAGRTLTYREVGAQVDTAAARLTAQGVTAGTRVGLLLANTPTYIVYFYAALKCGAVVVNFNPAQPYDDVVRQVRDSGTTVMVTLDLKPLFDKVEALLEAGILSRAVIVSLLSLLPPAKAVTYKLFKSREIAQPARSPQIDKLTLDPSASNAGTNGAHRPIVSARDLAVIQYTGGATGTPKGAMLTHANLTANAAQLTAWSASTVTPGQERILAVLPFFHVFAMTTIVIFGIAHGAEIVIQPRFQLDETMELIARTRPTLMPGVPTLFSAIAHHKRASKAGLGSLKLCLSGGAGLPVEVAKAFHAASGAMVVEAYGLSETSPGVTCNPLDGRAREGSIGLPLPGTRVVIADPEQVDRDVPLGQTGEIRVAGPQVMAGYWNQPEETAAAFVGNSFRTGDIGYMDRDGFVYVVDRIKDVIIISGFKVYPRQIEDKLYQHPAVEEATVIGIPDARRGAVPKAFVKLKTGSNINVDDLVTFLEPRLSKVEMPVAIVIRDTLPKSVIGKLSKKELVAEEAAQAGQSGAGQT